MIEGQLDLREIAEVNLGSVGSRRRISALGKGQGKTAYVVALRVSVWLGVGAYEVCITSTLSPVASSGTRDAAASSVSPT